MRTADKLNIFCMGPTEWHRRTGRLPAHHRAVRQIIGIPKLLGNHSTVIGKSFQRGNERLRIASSGKFVMSAFPSQNWPAATDASAVESAPSSFCPYPS